MCLFTISYIFYDEVSVQIFCLLKNFWLFFSLLSLKCSLYILDRSFVSDMCFLNIFSVSVVLIFIFVCFLQKSIYEKISKNQLYFSIQWTIRNRSLKIITIYNSLKYEIIKDKFKKSYVKLVHFKLLTLLREIKEDLNEWRDIICSWIWKLSILRCKFFLLSYRFDAVPIKIKQSFSESDKIIISDLYWSAEGLE